MSSVGGRKLTHAQNPADGEAAHSGIPLRLRISSLVLRAVFIVLLLVVTLRVSMPQNETVWTAYDTPGDLVRMALGFAVCVWLIIQLFIFPKDAEAYRTWLYVGLVGVPFTLICIFGTW